MELRVELLCLTVEVRQTGQLKSYALAECGRELYRKQTARQW